VAVVDLEAVRRRPLHSRWRLLRDKDMMVA